MFKPYKILPSNHPSLESFPKDFNGNSIALVEVHPDEKVARIIAFDDSLEDSWLPQFLNEQHVSCEIEKEILEKDLQKAISAAKATCENMEEMERDLYLELNEKEKRIEDLEYLLYECLDGLSKKELISKIKEALK